MNVETEMVDRGAKIVERIKVELSSKSMKRGDFYKYSGINSQSLRNWKMQNSIPGTETAIKMAEYLRVSVKYLITGINDIDISKEEREFIFLFKQLDAADKKEAIDYIQFKLKNKLDASKRGENIYNSETG